jgi:hypothetical protein
VQLNSIAQATGNLEIRCERDPVFGKNGLGTPFEVAPNMEIADGSLALEIAHASTVHRLFGFAFTLQ